jgi:hypothetical protein
MEKKTIIDKVKSLFSEIEDKGEVKMIYYTTKEGVEVKIPEGAELVVGTPVSITSEDGSEVPAPAGDHIIEDKIITLDENGVIASIAEIEVEVIEPAEEEMSTEEVKTAEEETKEVETMEEVKIEDLVKRIDELEMLMSEMKDKLTSVNTLEEKFSKLSKEPAEKEVKLSKANLTNNNNKSNTNALLELAKYRKK